MLNYSQISSLSSQATDVTVITFLDLLRMTYFLIKHSSIMCCIDCTLSTPSPQSYFGLSLNFHFCTNLPNRPCLIQFSLVHSLLGRFILAKSYAGTNLNLFSWNFSCLLFSTNIWYLLSCVANFLALQRKGLRDLILEFSSSSLWIDNVIFLLVFSFSLSTQFCLSIWEDSMLSSIESHSEFVPVIMLITLSQLYVNQLIVVPYQTRE